MGAVVFQHFFEPSINQTQVIKDYTVTQTSPAIAGQATHYTALVPKSAIKAGQYYVELPKGVKITHVGNINAREAESIRASAKDAVNQTLTEEQRQRLVSLLEKPKDIFAGLGKFVATNVRHAVAGLVERATWLQTQIIKTKDASFLDLSYQLPERQASAFSYVISFAEAETEAAPVQPETPEPEPVVEAPVAEVPAEVLPVQETATVEAEVPAETEQQPQVQEEPFISATQNDLQAIAEDVSPSGQPVMVTEIQVTESASPADEPQVEEYIQVDFQVLAPQMTEQVTSRGKEVTILSQEGLKAVPSKGCPIEEKTAVEPVIENIPTESADVGDPLAPMEETPEPQDIQAIVLPSDEASEPQATLEESFMVATPQDLSTEAPSTDTVSEGDQPVIFASPADTIAEVQTEVDPCEPLAPGVLAFTNIPEMFNVGQEYKIQVTWKNTENQTIEFTVHDLNKNGKLDYIEWTVVPSSTAQTFDIVYFSKAFQLDKEKNNVKDVYDTLRMQDEYVATLKNGEFLRVTFPKPLTNTDIIEIYASAVSPSTIEVFSTDTNQFITAFNNIDIPYDYKISLASLTTSVQTFDLKVTGEVTIDSIINPGDTLTISENPTENVGEAPNWQAGPGGGNINIEDVNAALSTEKVVTLTASGDITINNPIKKTAGEDSTLVIHSDANIVVNSDIISESNQLDVFFNEEKNTDYLSRTEIIGTIQTNGGDITIGGGVVMVSKGTLDARGNLTGNITINTRNVLQQGSLYAGNINIQFTKAYIDSEASVASTKDANNSTIHINGGSNINSHIFASGNYDTTGIDGGTITLEARNYISVLAAQLNASGTNHGGTINIGGGWKGEGKITQTQQLIVNAFTNIQANGIAGNGGTVVLWSTQRTRFDGTIKATSQDGNGGNIEISSKNEVSIDQDAVTDASSQNGQAGQLLLDPKNIIIATGGTSPNSGPTYFEFSDPNADTGAFSSVTPITLSSGNEVITDTGDDLVASNAGAVYLFNGTTGALIATQSGSTASDAVGTAYALTGNGHYVVKTPNWDNGGTVDVGAVAWCSGTTGCTGAVSTSNALYGGTASDQVGGSSVLSVLSDGDYAVSSTLWDNGGTANVGASTWCSGTSGCTGLVSTSNSLYGSTASDSVGSATALTGNGNYVVAAPSWDNGATNSAGAFRWCSGVAGCTGALTTASANTIYGSTATDQFSGTGVTALSNGNFFVASQLFDSGGVANIGAVTWCSGTSGCTTAAASSSNSLVGSSTSDQVGIATTALTGNGNYLVYTPSWNNGGTADVGANTWCSGTSGCSGTISSSNSFIGGTASDILGAPTVLTNGNYVLTGGFADLGGVADVGSASWCSGTSGCTGTLSTSNSLYGGTVNDGTGLSITALSDGDYVVNNTSWDNGGTANVGAVTWCSGTSGCTGLISTSNSLYGGTTSDAVGATTALTGNGNYIVLTGSWSNGGVAVGAATWCSGTSGCTGLVSTSNSVYGSTASDLSSGGSIVALSDGDYLVDASRWDNGGVSNIGAVVLGNGSTGTTGVISTSNALYGVTADDRVGSLGATALTNGNYVVVSPLWDNGGTTNVGAVTWGNGSAGTTGAVSTSNSLYGSTASDGVGAAFASQNLVTALSTGHYLAPSYDWDNGGTVDAGAVTICSGTAGCTGTISSSNSIIGPSASSNLNTTTVSDTVNNRAINSFASGQKAYSTSIYLATSDPNVFTYAFDPTADYTLAPSYLTATLNAGTNVVLQANNDITVSNDIIANNGGGNGGALTLSAGRSVILNANIATDNGALTITSNDTAANGVVNANRASGTASITMASGKYLNSGSAATNITLSTGTGNTYTTSGNITLYTIASAALTVANNGPDAGSVLINSGISAAGAISITGITSLGADVSTTSGAITFSSAVTMTADSTVRTSNAAVTFSSTINGAFGLSVISGSGAVSSGIIGGSTPITNLTYSGSGGTWTLGGAITMTGNLTLSAGTLDVSGSNFGITVGGDWIDTGAGTFTEGTGTVTFNGTSGTINANETFNNVTINHAGTTTLGAALTTAGNLTITSGILDVTTTPYNISLAGNWSNSGTFTARTGTVTMTGTGKSVSGNTTFYNLTKTSPTPDTLTFQSGATQTIASGGTLTLAGASGQLLTLAASAAPTKWILTVNGSSAVSYVTVSYSDASGGSTIVPTNSTDGNNNLNWQFNTAPSIGTGPSDGGALSSPINAGSNVTFTATATDGESDNYYFAICKTNSITAVNSGAPTCAGGTWAISSSTTSGSQASVTYTTVTGDAESNVWYAFVCDHDSASQCSSASQGLSTNGSPFEVNHVPTFTSVANTGGTILGDAEVSFTSVASDADTDGTADTVQLFICKSNDFSGGVCGAAGTWCSSSASASDPTCSHTVSVSDGDNSHTYYAYIADNHSFEATANPKTGSFTTDVTVSFADGDNAVILPSTPVPSPIIPNPLPPIIQVPINQVGEIIEQIGEILVPKPEPLDLPPIEQVVLKDPPLVFQGNWNIIAFDPLREFLFAPLTANIKQFVNKIPEIKKTFEATNVITMNSAVQKLRGVELVVPGFSDKPYNAVPSEILFAKAPDTLLDYTIIASLNNQGNIQQKINTVAGSQLALSIKPEGPVNSVHGYLLLTSVAAKQTGFEKLLAGLRASLDVFNYDAVAKKQDVKKIENKLLIQEFDYTDPDADGVYTANILAPGVDGEYEVITIMDYKDVTIGSKEVRLIVVVDPEGYVYTNMFGGELRVRDALVSIYWLNPETQKYELWPAADYQQVNPQITDKTGKYAFLVREGMYYITVLAKGYASYRSDVFMVRQNNGVHMNVELHNNRWWMKILDWRALLILAIGICAGGALGFGTLRSRR